MGPYIERGIRYFLKAALPACMLFLGAPAVNADNHYVVPPGTAGASDLDGSSRIRYKTVDMGAYECVYNGTFYTFH